MLQIVMKAFLVLVLVFCTFCRTEARLSELGCYKDRVEDRTMPELLFTKRNPAGPKLDWRNLEDEVIKPCKDAARKKGYECFGIQFYGECWSGEDACENYGKYGNSEECFCSKEKYRKYEEDEPCPGAVGGDESNFVYQIEG